MTASGFVELPSASLRAGDNDRTAFDPTALGELAESIAANGLAQPPTVRPLPDGMYEVVCGERRLRACRSLGWSAIPVVIRELDDEAAARIMLAENVARAELSPMDEARAYRKRMDSYGWSVSDLATAVGVPAGTIRNKLQLLALTAKLQEMVETGAFPERYAKHVHRLDSDRQHLAFAAWRDHHLAPGEYLALVERLQSEQDQSAFFDADDFLQTEEYALAAKAAPRLTTRNARTMIARLVECCTDPELAAEARRLVES